VGFRVRGALTALRPATADDVDLLVRWHLDPDVARYWDGETYTPEQMRERLEEREVEPYMIEERDGDAVGYAQAWPGGERTGGIDMFLVPDARGRGYGPDAARALATYLRGRGWTTITVDPYVWNEPAIRAWERAGFVAVGERPEDAEHTSAWLLMEFRAD
jgi:aminoglycoside 6'-N-acetyltransferase